MKKKLAYALTASLAMLMAIGFGAPAAQAKASDCKEAQLCFFADRNFEGKRLYWWDDQLKLSTKLSITSHEPSWTASSVINRTPYYAHIWNARGEHRCLPPGYNFTYVGDAYDNKITHIGLYVDWC